MELGEHADFSAKEIKELEASLIGEFNDDPVALIDSIREVMMDIQSGENKNSLEIESSIPYPPEEARSSNIADGHQRLRQSVGGLGKGSADN